MGISKFLIVLALPKLIENEVIIDLKVLNKKQNINKKFFTIENTFTNLIKVQKRTGPKEKIYTCYKISNKMLNVHIHST